jgi:carbonic anhydrase
MPPADPGEALARLLEGNRRYVEGQPRTPVHSAQRVELANGQRPFAAVLGCSDSRVPIETVFDQGPGDLFVIRLAGNIVTGEALGSIEYAVEILGSILIVVLGHSGCGAVAAAASMIESGTAFPGYIALLAEAIAPAATDAREKGGDWHARAVEYNVRASKLAIMRRSTIVCNAVDRDAVRVAGATYDLHSGVVTFLD